MKRQTKAQKDETAKAALYVRVRDMASGAAGYDVGAQDECLTLECAARLVPVLQETFGTEENKYLFHARNLDSYETVDKLTDFLFRHGVRAK